MEKINTVNSQNKPIILYCWRGGLRSQLVANWLYLQQYDVSLLLGGYKNYRNSVLQLIEKLSHHKLLVLNGKTGSGKTEVIEKLIEKKMSAINLEALAGHRGSAFGGLAQKDQPATQQIFENRLADEYNRIRKYPCIIIENENAIGPVIVNKNLRDNIRRSPMVNLHRSLDERAKHIVAIYAKNWNRNEESIFLEKVNLLKNIFVRKT